MSEDDRIRSECCIYKSVKRLTADESLRALKRFIKFKTEVRDTMTELMLDHIIQSITLAIKDEMEKDE